MRKNKVKQVKYENEDTKEIKNLIIIVISIVIVSLGLFFLTDKVMEKEETTNIDFSYDECLIGTMFNRPYDEYYVFAYSSKDDNASQYYTLKLNYEKKEDSIKIYNVDMATKFNSIYLNNESNSRPTSVSEVKIKQSALFHIKDGKVINFYETNEDYEKVLN